MDRRTYNPKQTVIKILCRYQNFRNTICSQAFVIRSARMVTKIPVQLSDNSFGNLSEATQIGFYLSRQRAKLRDVAYINRIQLKNTDPLLLANCGRSIQ